MQSPIKFKNLTLLFVLPAILSGCVVGAVADLAATTVVTAGKLAVKGTGALISAAIPDGDDDKKDKKKAHKEPHGGQTIQSPRRPMPCRKIMLTVIRPHRLPIRSLIRTGLPSQHVTSRLMQTVRPLHSHFKCNTQMQAASAAENKSSGVS